MVDGMTVNPKACIEEHVRGAREQRRDDEELAAHELLRHH